MNAARQGNLYTVKLSKTHFISSAMKRSKAKRGRITGFSSKSRSRLQRLLAATKWESALFVTLTSREDSSYDQLRAFLKRFFRTWGQHPVIWKRELQKRGVVHWHLIIITSKFIPLLWIKSNWSEVIGEECSVDIKFVRGRGKVARYLSKYVAKAVGVEDGVLDKTSILGRRWWGVLCRWLLVYYEVETVKLVGTVLQTALKIIDYVKSKCYIVDKVSFVHYDTS